MRYAVIVLLLIVFMPPLFAADLPPGRWWRSPEIVAQLELSQDQQSRLDAIFRSAANRLIDARGEVEKLQIAIRTELDQPQLNRANLQRLANELSAARGRLFENEIMMLVDMRGVLNEFQWSTLRSHLDRRARQRSQQQRKR